MSALLFVVVTIVIAIVIRFYEKNTNAMCKSKKKLDGKIAIVTGGTAGMGLEIAKEFARREAKVIIACPFKEEGVNARKEIVEETGNEKIIFKLLDLSSIESVRKFAADIINTEDRLDILINNAGVGVPSDFVTADGMSFIMQVNYFGHFLLTLLLLPLLKKSGTSWQPSRIVNTSSILHQIGAYDIRNLNRTDHWFMFQIYAKSKICLVLFARELTKRINGSNVVINSVDPGAVGTRIFDSSGKIYGPIFTFLCNSLYKTPWEGAQTALYVALDSEAGEVSGEFFKNCARARAIKWAYSDKLARIIFDDSVKCVKLTDEELNACLA
ncbi:retinol dehydrogenase 11-like [Pectinophora gossypiella]|uniref:retinol dehydrogenase 11-like n=1 Tax=Pectinophora gossypiella TaxID=13191 RepID=UPI00214E9267|nr:retinol dehydrogenase 11-like [Pectinophora gossypiella]